MSCSIYPSSKISLVQIKNVLVYTTYKINLFHLQIYVQGHCYTQKVLHVLINIQNMKVLGPELYGLYKL